MDLLIGGSNFPKRERSVVLEFLVEQDEWGKNESMTSTGVPLIIRKAVILIFQDKLFFNCRSRGFTAQPVVSNQCKRFNVEHSQ